MESIISEVVTHQDLGDAYVIRQIFLDQCRVSDATIPVKTLTRGRSRHQRCSVRKGVPRNFTKFTGKHVCQRLWHTCFPVNLAKFLRTLFSQNTSGPLLLQGVLHLFTSQKYIFQKQSFGGSLKGSCSEKHYRELYTRKHYTFFYSQRMQVGSVAI